MICVECGQQTLGRQTEATAATASTTVTLTPVTIGTCPAGHRTVTPRVDVVVTQIRDQLTVARRRRLGRNDRCGDCGADLVMPPRHTQTPVPVVVDGEVTTVLIECTMVRCPDCGREQVPSAVDADLEAAVSMAVEQAD